jgi:glycosyltransferase involved in cell wall biosynthesis
MAYPLLGTRNSNASQDRLAKSKSSPQHVRVRRLNYLGLPVITRPLNSISCRLAIESCVKGLEPDLILAFWTHPEGYAALKIGRRLNVPVVVGALGSDLLMSKGIRKYLTKRTVTKADRVLTVSDDLRAAAISQGASPERVKTIPNGCDHTIFYPRDRAACRAKLGINPEARLVLFVGWLTPLKGLPELVAAFSRVRRQFVNAELVCIGEGPLKQMLCATAPDDGVRAVGTKTSVEIAEWLGACDLLCLPSHSEGCPNVVVEALASGRPVIASQVGGIPELVDDHSGILVPFGDSSKLSNAICEGLKRNWDEDAIAARMSRSWDQVADDTYAVCLEVLAERKLLARLPSALAVQ